MSVELANMRVVEEGGVAELVEEIFSYAEGVDNRGVVTLRDLGQNIETAMVLADLVDNPVRGVEIVGRPEGVLPFPQPLSSVGAGPVAKRYESGLEGRVVKRLASLRIKYSNCEDFVVNCLILEIGKEIVALDIEMDFETLDEDSVSLWSAEAAVEKGEDVFCGIGLLIDEGRAVQSIRTRSEDASKTACVENEFEGHDGHEIGGDVALLRRIFAYFVDKARNELAH